ncbi:hypothetical protein SXCC_00949 [Gluconacetobacter sp. SXCC-1]|nr:hypothetical protein SXCC_00949 [Gluconacetobacter sp. SXCC-1]
MHTEYALTRCAIFRAAVVPAIVGTPPLTPGRGRTRVRVRHGLRHPPMPGHGQTERSR